ncbi:zf-HC2 domain-containing protein [bacterium]|nr:zf-HC2 domain-containing protein [bacterium]MBU1614069.1 zf-HC2 domain-containing protein [bacterium]
MKCKRVQRRLSAFLDRELKEREEKEIKTHLPGCSSCSKELKEMSSAWNLLLELKPVESPAYLIQRTIAEITTARGKVSWWQEILLRPAPVLATIALGILIGGLLGQSFYSNNNYLGEEFASSIYLDSFEEFPEGSVGEILLEEEEES